MIRVLIVDDDFMVAKVHRGFVSRVPGFEVVGLAHNGADALAEIERLTPDLVLLDIYLPDFTGLEVLRRLRDGKVAVDVLIVTAARDVETVREAMRGGVVHYLIKPFTFDSMRERLERYAVAHQGLAADGDIGQDDVDRLFVAMRPARVELPKGLNADTADLVGTALRKADDDLSAAECAGLAGLSRVATRRYLEHFVAEGKAAVRLRYGSAGRPERRYRWTARH
ncbi:response regulator [Phytomonospora sp. NPDC050363]|uniref:response regulator n=1 Tax=Phytomonospora sp. NPDC050363 TaxID=3155642 RepID=UPI0033C45C11